MTLSSNSILDFDSTGNSTLLVFSSFNPSGFTLNITNYTNVTFDGSQNSGTSTDDRLVFNSDQSTNISNNLFRFNGSTLGVTQIQLDNGFYEVGFTATPVPEPSTWVGAGLMTGLACWSQRRRLRKLKRCQKKQNAAVSLILI